ncbi:MAG TPA: glycosyltransferase family 1 protein [Campylobacterales bacterium]|nr:glycosyltransferase family 1 protein [Campylobacterales bacterium]
MICVMIKEKRIVLITDTLCDANGVSRFIQDIAKMARQNQSDFTAITSTGKAYCDEADNIVRLQPLLRFKMPFYAELDLAIPPFRTLYRTVKAKMPNAIHISTPGLVGLTGFIIAKMLKVPVYGTYHTDFASYLYSNTRSTLVKKLTRFFEKRFYRACKGVFIRSDIYRPLIQETFKINPEHVFTLPAGIDIHRYSPSYRDPHYWEQYGIDPNATKALYVGRVSTEKNIAFLLEVWKQHHDPTRNAWLILVGSGSFYHKREEYETYNIKFLGHKDKEELATIYPSSDFFVFPSNSDTLGQVVIEAMASGLPILVSDQGGPQTLISNTTPNGYILEQNKAERWWNTIEGMMTDEEERQRLSSNAAQLSQAFSIEKSFEFFWENHVPNL